MVKCVRIVLWLIPVAILVFAGGANVGAQGATDARESSAKNPLRVLVLIDEVNIDEPSRYVEARLAETIAARGYIVQDRSAVNWAEVQNTLKGGGFGPDTEWVQRIQDRFDLLLAGEATAAKGTTLPALERAGMTTVQARVNLRLYDVRAWAVIKSINERGSAAHTEVHTAGERAFDKALASVPNTLFGQTPELAARTMPATGGGTDKPGASGGAPPKPEISVDAGLLAGLPAQEGQNADAFAVVIGNTHYQKTKNVDYAINDATLIKTYLTRLLGYKEGNIFFVTDATKGDFELHFGSAGNHRGKLFNAVKPGKSDVFVYYAGHGAPGLKDQVGYFVPVDADPNYVEIQGYSTEVFYNNLAQVPSRSTTIVLDACFSGATYEGISPVGISFKSPVIRLENVVVFTSSTGTQASSWYDEKKHGLFTYMFASGLHGMAADADKNGVLTIDELQGFIANGSEGVPYLARRLHNVDQTPTMITTRKDNVFIKP